MNQTVVEMEGVESTEGLVLGHTSSQRHGVKMYHEFERRIGMLLRGEIPGYLAFWALSTDAWTSKDSKAYVDCTIRILVVNASGWKVYAVTLALIELGLKPSQFQYDHSMKEMKEKLRQCLAKFGFTLPLRQSTSCDNTSASKNLAIELSHEVSMCLTHRSGTVMLTSLEQIFDKKKHPTVRSKMYVR